MIGVPFAHVAGLPIEETVGCLGPVVLVAFGVTWARFRARLRGVRSRAAAHAAAVRKRAGRAAGQV